MPSAFSYGEFSKRNIGFVTEDEQGVLRDASVFVCGTGGMGGAGLMALARCGVGRFVIADVDRFELSNLNRQVFAFTDTVGRPKAEASAEILSRINPEARIEVLGTEWPHHVGRIIESVQVVINGTDDLGAGVLLYRTALRASVPVIDAYASPLPSVYVTRPGSPSPEERLSYSTVGKPWTAITDKDRRDAFRSEAIYVILHSSSRHHIDLQMAGEVAAGRRSRMSFAPMVVTTGMLMAYETVALLLGRKTGTDHRGWFFNPYKPAVERPRSKLTAALLRPLVEGYLDRLVAAA